MARHWARLGFRVVRVDLPGLGESDTENPAELGHPYAKRIVPDLRVVIDESLRRWGGARVGVIGLCSGAYLAFNAALAGLPIENVILINPQTFYWRDGDPLDVSESRVYEEMDHYRRSMWSVEKWKKALRGDVQYRHILNVLRARTKTVATSFAKRAARRAGIRTAQDASRDLEQILTSGTRMTIVFSKGDPGVDYLRRITDNGLKRLERRSDFRIEYIADADHTFTDKAARERLNALLTRALESMYPGRAAPPAQAAASAAVGIS
jgi:pimeloyl-ACP methyl ester carboxylesterase